MHSNEEKFAIKLESEEGLEKIILFLKKEIGVKSQELNEINKRIRPIKRRYGFRNYEEMLTELINNPILKIEVIRDLKNQKKSNENKSQINFLTRRKKTLKDYINVPEVKTKKKKSRRRRKIDIIKPSANMDYSIPSTPQDTQNLDSILNFLSERKINCEAYKQNYFIRRLQTRMRKLGLNSYRDYRDYLKTNPNEPKLLVSSFSINVTHFFRDRDLFIELQRKVLPEILKSDPVRIWSAGCAVGPEPYSIAMLINRLTSNRQVNSINILATDISQDFLDQAKLGRYPQELLKELDSSEIKEFFVKLNNSYYQISSSIRNYVSFKKHDLRTQPPGSNFDLILCRNVLIYFSRSEGKQLFQRFYSALKPNGYLVIGSCELIHPKLKDKFEIIDTQNRIYRRIT